jgi:uncharacterized protein YbbC (DUF1343 family)
VPLCVLAAVVGAGCGSSSTGAGPPATTLPAGGGAAAPGPAATAPAAPQPERPGAPASVTIGVERLDSADAAGLRSRRVGLVANAASVTGDGRSSIRALRESGVRVARLFSPEHGFGAQGAAGALQGSGRAFGVRVISLYGERKAPTRAELAGLDALVYDLQDVGVRFYTYVSTMVLAMRSAARAGVPFVVLDRPNPLGGELVAGPVRRGPETFVATTPGPLVYGLTAGEMARLVNARDRPRARLTVVRMAGWRRSMTWPQTGRRWVPPSPGLRTWQSALTYPGMALFEGTVASAGGGTNHAYRMLCAPWLDGERLTRLASRLGAGARPVTVVPRPVPSAREPKFLRRRCRGTLLTPPADDALFDGYRVGLGLLVEVRRHRRFRWLQDGEMTDAIVGTPRLRRRVDAGWSLRRILAAEAPAVRAWQRARRPYLLY